MSGDSVFAGGHFGSYCVGNTGGGKPFTCSTDLKRSKLMEVSLSTGAVTGWAPELNSPHGVFTTEVDASGALWVGGDFTEVDGDSSQAHLAVFPGGGTTPPTSTAPSAPTGLTATAGDATVALAWQPPTSNGGSAVTGYNLYRAVGSGNLALLTRTSSTSYTNTAVTNGTTYSYVVKAVNVVGEGPASSSATATPSKGTQPPTAPSAPTGLTATAGDATVALAWQPPTSNGGSAVTGYNLYRAVGSGSLALLTRTSNTSYTDTAVTNGTTYSYVVKAVNVVGEGPASSSATATPSKGTPGGGPCGTKVGQPRVINHVVMLIFENKARTQVMGQSYAPYLNSLADKCGEATNMQALSNTSLANYIALTSGYTGHPKEITSNRDPKRLAPGHGQHLRAAGHAGAGAQRRRRRQLLELHQARQLHGHPHAAPVLHADPRAVRDAGRASEGSVGPVGEVHLAHAEQGEHHAPGSQPAEPEHRAEGGDRRPVGIRLGAEGRSPARSTRLVTRC